MKILILLITAIFCFANALPKTYTSKKALLEDQKQHCDSLCTTYDGVFEFNDKLKTCICYVGKYFDDMEVGLMRKNAKVMGMNLKTIKSTPKIMSKRDTLDQDSANIKNDAEEPKKSLFAPIKKGPIFSNLKEKQPLGTNSKFQLPQSIFSLKKKDATNEEGQNGDSILKEDAIVGARANINTRANARPIQISPLQPQSGPFQNVQPIAMKDVWMKARQRLDHLIKHSEGGRFNSRFAQSETQAIRNALKPLTLKKKPNSGPKPIIKPSTGLSRNSGLNAGPKHGTSLGKLPQGLKVPGNPLKPGTANLKPFQPNNNKPQLNPLSGGLLTNGKGNQFKLNGQIRSRTSGHSLVGAAGPSEAAEGPQSVPTSTAKPSTVDSSVNVKVEAGKEGKKYVSKKEKKVTEKEARTKKGDLESEDSSKSKIVLQPDNTLSDEEDLMAE